MSHTPSSDVEGRLWHPATWQGRHAESNNRMCSASFPSTNCPCRVYPCILSMCSAEAAHPLPLGTGPTMLYICPVLYVELAATTTTSITTCVHSSPVMDEGHCLALGQQLWHWCYYLQWVCSQLWWQEAGWREALCTSRNTTQREEANSKVLHYSVIVSKAVKGPWKVNHIHIHTQRTENGSCQSVIHNQWQGGEWNSGHVN